MDLPYHMQSALNQRRAALDDSEDSWSDGEDREAKKKKKALLKASKDNNAGKKSFNEAFGIREKPTPSSSFAANKAALAAQFGGGGGRVSTTEEQDDNTPDELSDSGGGFEYHDSSGGSGWGSSSGSGSGGSGWDATGSYSSLSPLADNSSLNDDYTEKIDPESGYPYYVHNITGESTWEKPLPKIKPPPPSNPPNRNNTANPPIPPIPNSRPAPPVPSSNSFNPSPSMSGSAPPIPPSPSSPPIPPSPPVPFGSNGSGPIPPSFGSPQRIPSTPSSPISPTRPNIPLTRPVSTPASSNPTISSNPRPSTMYSPQSSLQVPQSNPQPQRLSAKWKELIDPASGAPYYCNLETQETVWDKPADFDGQSSSSPSNNPNSLVASFSSSVSLGASYSNAPSSTSYAPSSPWRELIDPSSGAPYYENSETGVTQWEKPPGFGANVNQSLVGSQNSYPSPSNTHSGGGMHARGPSGLGLSGPMGAPGKTVKLASVNQVRKSDNFRSNPNQYPLVEFARANFEQHTRGLIFKDVISVEDMLSHTRDKLKKSLLKPPAVGTSSYDEFFVDRSIQAFRNVTGYMQDRESSKDPYGHALKLTARGLCGSPEMRDEIFCQIIKQLTRNPNPASTEKGWQLLSLCCGLFPPSDKFANYLYCFLLQNASQGSGFAKEHALLSVANLDDTMINGARLQTPTLVEVKSYESLRPVVLNVETLDPSLHWPVTCSAQMRISDVFKYVGSKVVEGDTSGNTDTWLNNFGIFQAMLINDRLSACCALTDSSRVLDVISFWSVTRSEFHKSNSSGKLAFKFVFMVQFYLRHLLLMPSMPSMVSHLYYVQSVTDLRRGIYLCTEKEAYYLAALQLQVRLGNSLTPSDYNMLELLPVPLVAAKPKLSSSATHRRELFDEIDKLRSQFNGWSVVQSKAQLLSYMSQWKHYGLSTFPVKQQNARSKKERILEIGINEHGLFKIDPKSRAWWQIAPMSKILMYEAVVGAFKFVIGDKQSSTELLFEVQYADELKKLVQKYKLTARLDDSKPATERTLIPIQRNKYPK